MIRTKFRFFIVILLVGLLCRTQVWAQTPSVLPSSFPNKPIRVVVTTVAGGGIDLMTRPVVDRLSKRVGRSIVVDNKAGASGLIGTNLVADTAADGATMLSTGDSFIVNGALKRLSYDIRQVFTPVAQLSVQDYMVFSHPSLPVNNFNELLTYARTNPGKLSLGSPGIASLGHLGLELIKSKVGVNIVHVPYKGNAQASIDLASGRIQLMFGNIAGVQMVRAGKARLIGVMSPDRLPEHPDMPTVNESGVPGFELKNTYSLYMLAKTPASIVSAFNREILQILTDPEIKEKYAVDSS